MGKITPSYLIGTKYLGKTEKKKEKKKKEMEMGGKIRPSPICSRPGLGREDHAHDR
jgi:hypothetical protein